MSLMGHSRHSQLAPQSTFVRCWSNRRQNLVPSVCPRSATSGHDRPHSSTLAPKQEKRIRLRPPIVIDPPIVAAPRRIASLDVPIAPGKKEAGVAPEVVARKVAIGGRLARYKAALGLVAQHRDKFGAIVGLATQRLVRNDDRGARQGGLRDSIEHVLRDGDAVERVLGFIPLSIVTAVQRRPASLRAIAVNTCVPIGLSGLRIVTGTSMVASNTSPPSGHGLCVLRRT